MFPSSPISPKRGPKIRFPSDPDRVRNRESTAKSRANRANKLNQLKVRRCTKILLTSILISPPQGIKGRIANPS